MSSRSDTPLMSIIIPSRAQDPLLLQGILDALAVQSLLDFEVLIICDRYFSEQEWKEFLQFFTAYEGGKLEGKISFLSHCNSDFRPQSKGGASAVRNYGIKHARGSFIQLFDDDNRFATEYLETVLSLYENYRYQLGKEVIITPTLIRRESHQIQNQGFSAYNYWLARPQIHFLPPWKKVGKIQMFSGNGVFWNRELISSNPYDEEIAWIAEDLEFVYRLSQHAEVLVFAELKVYHHERDKTVLEQAWIGSPESATQKIRNNFLWVKKHGNLMQILIFLLRSSRGITVRLAIKALRYGGNQKWQIVAGVCKGYIKGWKVFLTRGS